MGRAGTPDTPRLATAAAIRRVRRSGPPHREDHGRRRETARAMSHMPHDGARSVGPRHPARRRPRPRRGRRQRGGKRRGLILGGGRGDVVPHAVRGTQARASSADSMSIASRYPVVNLISAMSQPPRARRDRVGPIVGERRDAGPEPHALDQSAAGGRRLGEVFDDGPGLPVGKGDAFAGIRIEAECDDRTIQYRVRLSPGRRAPGSGRVDGAVRTELRRAVVVDHRSTPGITPGHVSDQPPTSLVSASSTESRPRVSSSTRRGSPPSGIRIPVMMPSCAMAPSPSGPSDGHAHSQ